MKTSGTKSLKAPSGTFIARPRRLYGILGSPLGHSLSPAFHNLAFARAAYPGVYCLWEKQKDELEEFFRAVRSLPIAGLSVTIPHKQNVIPFLDELSARARLVGAVNTVVSKEGKLIGGNTDVDGFLLPLQDYSQKTRLPARALVLGAGGASRAVLAGLAELGLKKISVTARKREKTAALLESLPANVAAKAGVIAWEDRSTALAGPEGTLVVNTTPLGMEGAFPGQNPLPAEAFALLEGDRESAAAPSLFFDLVYAPRHTPFLLAARERGVATLDGTGFFAAQAARQFQTWTGLSLAFDEAGQILKEIS